MLPWVAAEVENKLGAELVANKMGEHHIDFHYLHMFRNLRMHWALEENFADILAMQDTAGVVRSEEPNSRMDSLLDT